MDDNGYTGLFNAEGECACSGRDLMDCGSCILSECEVGYEVVCRECDSKTRNSCEYLSDVHPSDRVNQIVVVREKCTVKEKCDNLTEDIPHG
jgi:hypothetical protein